MLVYNLFIKSLIFFTLNSKYLKKSLFFEIRKGNHTTVALSIAEYYTISPFTIRIRFINIPLLYYKYCAFCLKKKGILTHNRSDFLTKGL